MSLESNAENLWLDSLKVAVINENTQKILDLIQNLPESANISHLISAKEIVGEYLENLKSQRNLTLNQMQKLKEARRFLQD